MCSMVQILKTVNTGHTQHWYSALIPNTMLLDIPGWSQQQDQHFWSKLEFHYRSGQQIIGHLTLPHDHHYIQNDQNDDDSSGKKMIKLMMTVMAIPMIRLRMSAAVLLLQLCTPAMTVTPSGFNLNIYFIRLLSSWWWWWWWWWSWSWWSWWWWWRSHRLTGSPRTPCQAADSPHRGC